LTHNFVATYEYSIPVERWFGRNRITEGWAIAGTTRFSTGFPVTLTESDDNSLLGTLGNGVNNQLLDTPQVVAGQRLQLNTNPRNNPCAFNTNAFAPENLGQLGDAARRIFHGPGIENFDVQLTKATRIAEGKMLDFRIEAFNVFNHAQFYGPGAVDGNIDDPNFGRIVSAAAPRLIQVAAKVHF